MQKFLLVTGPTCCRSGSRRCCSIHWSRRSASPSRPVCFIVSSGGGWRSGDKGRGGNLDQSSSVQAVCDMWGPTDFLQMDAHAVPQSRLRHNDPRSPESLLIGGPILENKIKVAKANPISYIDKSDPPFLIIHGSQDPAVPVHQSHLLHQALKAKNVPVKLHVVEGAGHGGREFNAPEIDTMIVEFFDTQC